MAGVQRRLAKSAGRGNAGRFQVCRLYDKQVAGASLALLGAGKRCCIKGSRMKC